MRGMAARRTTRSPQSQPGTSQPSADWAAREQLSPPVEMLADKLLREAGSAERAKHAVDEAAISAEESEPRECLARQLGFVTFRELAGVSTSLVIPGSERWWVVRQGGRWRAWSGAGLLLERDFASVEEARCHITAGG